MCGISCIVAFREHTKKPVRLSAFQSSVTSKDVGTPARGSAFHNPFDDIPPHCVQRDDVQEALDASLDKIQHRGPDSRGHWISDDNRVGMLPSPSSNH
jgi:hypothetical protein